MPQDHEQGIQERARAVLIRYVRGRRNW